MKKQLLILCLLVIALSSYYQQDSGQTDATTGAQAMMVAIDPQSGSLVRPSLAQKQNIAAKQQAMFNDSERFTYRNTLTVHPDGTKSGVVDPQFLHSIYASINADGEIVLHEGKNVTPPQPELEDR